MTINELREEYREHCTRLRRYGRANSAHCYGAIGNPFPFCTICEDGECPRPTSPDKLISGVKNNTDGHGVSTNEVRHDG